MIFFILTNDNATCIKVSFKILQTKMENLIWLIKMSETPQF